MRIKAPQEWTEVAGTASITFGPVQLYCYRDPRGVGYRFKVGSLVAPKAYTSLQSAQHAGLRYLEKLGEAILEGVRALPEYEIVVKSMKQEPELDDWHLSILGLGKDKGE